MMHVYFNWNVYFIAQQNHQQIYADRAPVASLSWYIFSYSQSSHRYIALLSSSSPNSNWLELLQPDPRQFLHAGEHFLQVHLALPQLHLITRSSSCGAGGRSVYTGACSPLLALHPHSVGQISSPEPFHCCIWQYTRSLWYFAASDVGGKLCTWTWEVLLYATFSQNRLYRRECLQLSRHTNSPKLVLQQRI
jgi:hypothetical protein